MAAAPELQTLQTISAVCAIVSTLVALVAAVICLKISQQISQLETRIILRLADEYVSRDDLRMVCPRATAGTILQERAC